MKKFTLGNVWRFAAALLAFALIALILLIAGSFLGNPISAARARRDIRQYTRQHYAQLSPDIEAVKYNFKFGEYYALVRSPGALDTHFTVSWKNGSIVSDQYAFSVLGGMNTFSRLGEAFTEQLAPLVEDELGEILTDCRVLYTKVLTDSPDAFAWSLDMPYDRSLTFPANVILDVKSESVEEAQLLDVLRRTAQVIRAGDFAGVESVTVYWYTHDDEPLVFAADVPLSAIDAGAVDAYADWR